MKRIKQIRMNLNLEIKKENIDLMRCNLIHLKKDTYSNLIKFIHKIF